MCLLARKTGKDSWLGRRGCDMVVGWAGSVPEGLGICMAALYVGTCCPI